MTGAEIFGAFCDKDVEIFKSEHTGAYADEVTETTLAQIKADIQPYGTPHTAELSQKEYGLEGETVLALFCLPEYSEYVIRGNFVRYNGEDYVISRADRWEYGTEALLNERD